MKKLWKILQNAKVLQSSIKQLKDNRTKSTKKKTQIVDKLAEKHNNLVHQNILLYQGQKTCNLSPQCLKEYNIKRI